MLSIVRTRLVVKLALLLLSTVAAGFLAATSLAARAQTRSFDRMQRQSAALFARSLAAGVRSTMVTGDPLATQQMLGAAQQGAAGVTVRVYAPNGEQVWAPRGRAPTHASLLAPLREALERGAPQARPGGGTFAPMAHEARCAPCHEAPAQGALRGVLELSARATRDDDALRATLTAAVRAGFVQIMTARRSQHLDRYFNELKERAPAVRDVAVYDPEGAVSFGNEQLAERFPAFTAEAVGAAIRANAPRTERVGDAVAHLVPLPNEARCHGCHNARDAMRGPIVVVTPAAAPALEPALVQLSDLSVRHIMLSGLGRLTAGYLDALAETGALSAMRLYDEEGRLYHDALATQAPPSVVAQALREGLTVQARGTEQGHETFTFVEALRNDAQCQRCHGNDRPVRGAIEIELDARQAAQQQRALARNAALSGLATLFVIFFALYFALRSFVLRPVQNLSLVADHIGKGNLDVEAEVRSQDEIGRLATRVNEMALGLRQRLHLAKFVSQSTVAAVESTARSGHVGLGGERKHTVVLFSDVRGFTAYSEKHEPEEVVAMLNTYLNAQTEVVHKHGGDVDKFVGDELMALFFGDDAELRATRCAVEMIEAVSALNAAQGLDEIAVGVGVNAGPAIVGAMGARERMDFTAIGDAVNLGARLCSNAGRNQALLSRAVRDKLGDAPGLALEALAPLKVKGKEQPVEVFAARRA